MKKWGNIIRMKKILTFCTVVLVYWSSMVQAHEEHTPHQPSVLAMSVAFDAAGNLWRVSSHGAYVQVDSSRDLAKSFSKPILINPIAQNIAVDSEARPKIAIGPEGNIYLTWTATMEKLSTGYVWFARSINGGKTFETPVIVHQHRAETTNRFDALNVATNGNITVAWVDAPDLIAAKSASKPYESTAIYYAVSSNQGANFSPEQMLADSNYECCRIAFTNKPDGTVVAMWHHVFESSERDLMIAEIPLHIGQPPVIKRATFDRWKADGCPHNCVALVAGGEGKNWWGYHMAWFDGGNDEAGKNASLRYARMDGEAWVSTPAKKFGNDKNQAAYPALLSLGEKVWLVWRESETNVSATKNTVKNTIRNTVLLLFSDDGGRSWGDAKVLATTLDKADYPQLLVKDNQPYLAWNTLNDGLQLIGL